MPRVSGNARKHSERGLARSDGLEIKEIKGVGNGEKPHELVDPELGADAPRYATKKMGAHRREGSERKYRKINEEGEERPTSRNSTEPLYQSQ